MRTSLLEELRNQVPKSTLNTALSCKQLSSKNKRRDRALKECFAAYALRKRNQTKLRTLAEIKKATPVFWGFETRNVRTIHEELIAPVVKKFLNDLADGHPLKPKYPERHPEPTVKDYLKEFGF